MVRAIPYVGDAGNGARLLARTFIRDAGTTNNYAPDLAGYAVVAGIGAGGTRHSEGNGAGGGAAWAKAGFFVNPDDNVIIVVPPGNNTDNSAGGDFSATLNSVVKVLAKGGGSGPESPAGGPGGQASACIGDVKRTGGSGGAYGSTVLAATGSVGVGGSAAPVPNNANQPTGGTSASDLGDDVEFGLGTSPIRGAFHNVGSGGGLAGGIFNQGGAGEGVIEFWTSNPNL